MTKQSSRSITVELSKDVASNIAVVLKKRATTPCALLLAVSSGLLHRYTDQDFCCLGLRRLNKKIFRYVEIDFYGNPTLNKIIEHIRFQTGQLTYANQVVWNEYVSRDSFEFVFPAYFMRESAGVYADPRSAEYYRNGLCLTWEPHLETGLKFTLTGHTRLYSKKLLEQIAEHLKNLLADMTAHPERRVSDIRMLSPEEIYRLIIEWNGAVIPYEERCIHQFFEDQAARTPDAIALHFEDRTLTYRELNIRANSLARRLRSLGARPEIVVGIGMYRSLQAAVCLLAILKSGAAYTVVDPDSPPARIKDIISLSSANIVLTDAACAPRFRGVDAKVLTVDVLSDAPECQSFPENFNSGVTVDNAAYVLFTSGSTGKPKGVIGIHRSMAHLYGFGRFSYITEPKPDVCCLNAPLGFLGAVSGLLMPLCCGLPVVIIPNGQERDPYTLAKIIHKNGINNITMVPSMLKQLFTLGTRAKSLLKSVARVGVSGAALDRDTITTFHKIMPRAALTVGYASTEIGSVIFGNFVDLENDGKKGPVPVGRVGPNVRAYILDRYMNLVPVRASGELHVAADYISRGYAGQPELTAERFVHDPFFPGKQLFRTGDVMRFRFDGKVEYIRRSDNQVKVRGFRVELGEIETVLTNCNGVSEAVAVKNEREKSQRLVAYIVKKPGAKLNASALHEYLLRRLPQHMVPAAFIFLEQMPLTANGKIDRYTLSLENLARPVLENAYAPPKDELEAELIEIWQSTLGVQNIGIHDEFLEIGGESILAAVIVEKIYESFSVEIPLPLFFSNLTVALLATEILRIRAES